MWELQQDILEQSGFGKGARLAQPDISLLPVTGLRQAIRVAGSSKMPEACIIAICKYAKGVPYVHIMHTTSITVSGAVRADWMVTVDLITSSALGERRISKVAANSYGSYVNPSGLWI